MSLRDSVFQLCSEHSKFGPDGKAHKVPALLDELRAAVTPGNSMSGGGASGAPSPINVSALDLLGEIESESRRDYYEITDTGWQSTLEELLQHYAEVALTPEWCAYLERVTLEYVDKINALLWPIKPRRKLVGKVCPSCGWATYGEERKTCLSLGCWDDTGNMRAIGTWDVECASCEAAWSGDQVSWLLKALDAPSEELTHTG